MVSNVNKYTHTHIFLALQRLEIQGYNICYPSSPPYGPTSHNNFNGGPHFVCIKETNWIGVSFLQGKTLSMYYTHTRNFIIQLKINLNSYAKSTRNFTKVITLIE